MPNLKSKFLLTALSTVALLLTQQALPALAAAPKNSTEPTISGTASVGGTLTGNQGVWQASPSATYTFSWFSCTASVKKSSSSKPSVCTPIADVSTKTYSPSQDLLGKYISFAVTATNSNGSATKWSKTTAPIAMAPSNSVPPTVSGSTVIGQTQTARPGTWAGSSITYAYLWYRCTSPVVAPAVSLPATCVSIGTATKTTYVSVAADAAKFLSVRVTATNTTGSASMWSATPLQTGAPYNTVAPSITGTATVGSSLVGAKGTWVATPAVTNVYANWYYCTNPITAPVDSKPEGCTKTGNETSAYTPVLADAGKYISFAATYQNANGGNTKWSVTTVAVTSPPVNTSVPTISGTARVGETLTASPGSWGGAPTTVNGFWYRCAEEIPAATDVWPANCDRVLAPAGGSSSNSYTLKPIDAGYNISYGTFAANSLGMRTYWSKSKAAIQMNTTSVASAIALSVYHACAIVQAGGIECWGDNGVGAFGDGTNNSSTTPVVTGITGATAISAGIFHTCAIVAEGAVHCWGNNWAGQLGDGTLSNSNAPVDTGITGATAISAGDNHTCAILIAGAVKCWGYNVAGQLGDGTNTNSNTPVDTGITGATSISAGLGSTCAIVAAGAVKCWGYNGDGQLGDGTYTSSNSPVDIGITGATSISVGPKHTCVIVAAGEVKCWGYNYSGQLGDGTNNNSNTPVDTGITGATAISVADNHSCAILASGALYCWGYNLFGQLGDGTQRSSNTPVNTGLTVAAISLREARTCAIFQNESNACWGQEGIVLGKSALVSVKKHRIYEGALISRSGALTNFAVQNPWYIDGMVSRIDISSLTIGQNRLCWLIPSNQVKCSTQGSNIFGEAGIWDSASGEYRVSGFSAPISIKSSTYHTCALESGGDVECWGRNTFGNLGNNSTTDSASAVKVVGVSNAVMIAAGWDHTCALLRDGTARCWGNNSSGQLGNGNFLNSQVSVVVQGLANAIAIYAGGDHTCALLLNESVKCWGANSHGELVTGATSNANVPTAANMNGVISIVMGRGHLCANFTDGQTKCIGLNDHGQLGDGTLRDSANLQNVVVRSSKYAQLISGDLFLASLDEEGHAYFWGYSVIHPMLGTLFSGTGGPWMSYSVPTLIE